MPFDIVAFGAFRVIVVDCFSWTSGMPRSRFGHLSPPFFDTATRYTHIYWGQVQILGERGEKMKSASFERS
jgi:hypothetical protein